MSSYFGDLDLLRKKLIDLTGRNSLIRCNLELKRPRHIDVVNVSMETLWTALCNGDSLKLLNLPETDDEADGDGNRAVARSVQTIAGELGIDPSVVLSVQPSARRKEKAVCQTLLKLDTFRGLVRRIRDNHRTANEEKGIHSLHCVFGFLEWQEAPISEVNFTSPLLLVPVTIEGKDGKLATDGCELVAGESAGDERFDNASLRLKLSQDFGVNLPEWHEGDTLSGYFGRVEQAIVAYSKWRVVPRVVVANFSFPRIALYEDLDPSRWQTDDSNGLLEHPILQELLGGREREPGNDVPTCVDAPDIRKPIEGLVFKADSSQLTGIARVASGECLVIEGPPGTGKSETISNLISVSMAQGKTVLFVADKKAAIEVVEQRLRRNGLDIYCLNLHENGPKAKDHVYERIRKRLEVDSARTNPAARAKREMDGDISQGLADTADKLDAHFCRMAERIGKSPDTVADILWSSLGSQTVREQLPECIRFVRVPNSLALSDDAADEISESLTAFESAVKQFSPDGAGLREHPLWGIRATTRSAFQSREITEHVSKLTAVAKGLEDLTESLKPIGFRDDLQLRDLRAVARLEVACTEDADYPLLSALLKHESCNNLDAALGVCLKAWPAGVTVTPDEANAARLRELAAVVHEYLCVHGKTDLTAAEVATMSQSTTRFIQAVDAIRQILDRLVSESTFAELNDQFALVGECLAIVEILREQPATTLGYLHAGLWDGVPEGHWAKLSASAREAAALYDVCHPHIPSDYFTSRDAVDPLVMTLLKGSLLSCLKPAWWRARAALRDSVSDESGTHAARIGLLKQLDRWHQLTGELNTDCHLTALTKLGTQSMATAVDEIARAQAALEQLRKAAPILWGALEQHGVSAQRVLEVTRQSLGADIDLAILIDPAQTDYREGSLAKSKEKAAGHLQSLENVQRCMQFIGTDYSLSKDLLVTLPKHFDRLVEVLGQGSPLCNWSLAELSRGTDLVCRLLSCVPIEFCTPFSRYMAEGKSADQVALRSCLSDLTLRLQDFDQSWAKFAQASELDERAFLKQPLESASVRELASRCGAAARCADQLARWIDMQNRLVGLLAPDSPVRELIQKLIETGTPPTGLAGAFRGLLADSRARDLLELQSAPHLTGNEVEMLRRRLVRDDSKWQKTSVEQARERVLSNEIWPGRVASAARDTTGLALIRHELSKRTRRISPRKLLDRAWPSLVGMMPCFMMSPTSVAQYLPAGLGVQFDLVLIDEASQMRPEEAMSVVLRGKQLVVVGDSQQLPPTTFFAGGSEEDDVEDEDALDMESILDMAKRRFSSHSLRWHYRSRHDSLIRFSNQRFYDDRLIVCPSPQPISGVLGLHLVRVAGLYHERQNDIEASKLVEKATELMRLYPNKSMGIVAMNDVQREEIAAQLQTIQQNDAVIADYIQAWEDKNNRCFVKNLENVQGDERDIILVSTVYGPTEEGGPVMRRFGPINSAVGHRRLNVLFTRARDCMYVFTSLKPSDVCPGDGAGQSLGVIAFAQFLEFAGSGILSNIGRSRTEDPDSPFEEYVGDLLRRSGYEFEYQVGQSGFRIDIGVTHPSFPYGFIAGIECDGAAYHSSTAARDRDRLRQDILEGHGWDIYRIWSTDWFNDPKHEGQKLIDWLDQKRKDKMAAIEPLLAQDQSTPVTRAGRE